MNQTYNPYKSALDGLILEDPVSVSLNFVLREKIRFKESLDYQLHGAMIFIADSSSFP